ncbi:MAG: substrate-binding domain-containing protein [Allorhizobium sp.]
MDKRKDFVSAQEVAERAGVSRSAVSRTFTDGASVSVEMRRRVLEAAEALGYHVNHLARGLMRDESGIVCLIVSDMSTPYRSSLIRALTQQLQGAGKVAMLINTDRSDKSVDLALRQAIRYRADASIILSGMPDKSITDLCLKNGQRLVLINRDDEQEGPLRINLDDAEAARRVLTAFLRAGCRRMAFANSMAGTPSLMERERGFVSAAAARGLTVAVERFGPTSYASGAVLAQRLLTRSDRPDAVFCATDLLACGFMDAARHQFSISVPGELCIAGFDDIEQASWTSYALTTFAQPIDRIAQEAVSWLAGDHEDLQAEQSLCRLPAELVWRNSIRGG